MSKMKSLVTGGAGFIGSHLVDSLLKENHEVLVVDNLTTGKKDNLDDLDSLVFIEKEIGSEEALSEIKKFNPDYCFHLAAQSSVTVSVDNPILDEEYNITQPLKLIDAIKNTNCSRFLFSSSGGTIYGNPKNTPTKEDDFGSEPASPYGSSKKRLNRLIEESFQGREIKYSILNFANVYGPRQDPHGEAGVISIFTRKMIDGENPTVYGTGKQTRDFVYVGDVVSAMHKCLSSEENHNLNIGSGVETSVLELVSLIEEAVSYKCEINYKEAREGELLRSVLDSSLAKETIGWHSETLISEGISEVISWIKNQRK